MFFTWLKNLRKVVIKTLFKPAIPNLGFVRNIMRHTRSKSYVILNSIYIKNSQVVRKFLFLYLKLREHKLGFFNLGRIKNISNINASCVFGCEKKVSFLSFFLFARIFTEKNVSFIFTLHQSKVRCTRTPKIDHVNTPSTYPLPPPIKIGMSIETETYIFQIILQ